MTKDELAGLHHLRTGVIQAIAAVRVAVVEADDAGLAHPVLEAEVLMALEGTGEGLPVLCEDDRRAVGAVEQVQRLLLPRETDRKVGRDDHDRVDDRPGRLAEQPSRWRGLAAVTEPVGLRCGALDQACESGEVLVEGGGISGEVSDAGGSQGQAHPNGVHVLGVVSSVGLPGGREGDVPVFDVLGDGDVADYPREPFPGLAHVAGQRHEPKRLVVLVEGGQDVALDGA